MGYRSDVVALIYPDAMTDEETRAKYEQLQFIMNTTFKELMEDDFGSCMEWIDVPGVLKFDIPNVKWYESYPSVRAFEAMLSTLSGDPDDGDGVIGGYCTEFMRIGEDDNDVERDTRGHNLYYFLRVKREIECGL